MKSSNQNERKKGETQNHLENKPQNVDKYIFINNYLKCQWTEYSIEKIQSGGLGKIIRAYNMLSTRDSTQDKGHIQIERGWEKIFHANEQDRKAGVAILISDKIDFKTKDIKKDKEGHYLMVKGSIQEKDITLVNIYVPNIRTPRSYNKN